MNSEKILQSLRAGAQGFSCVAVGETSNGLVLVGFSNGNWLHDEPIVARSLSYGLPEAITQVGTESI